MTILVKPQRNTTDGAIRQLESMLIGWMESPQARPGWVGRKNVPRRGFRRRGLPLHTLGFDMPCKACHEEHSPLLRCEVAARQRAVMDNAAWITPITAKNMDNSKSYRYRDPVKRRAQCAEAMKRYRARKKAAVGVD